MSANIFLKDLNLTTYEEELLEKYKSLVLTENKKYNLTAITDDKEFYIKHFYDSLVLNKFIKFEEGKNVLDIGSGGGFPAVCLAITNPNVNFILVEVTKKKANFLEYVKETLNLKNITVINKRAEELDDTFKEKFDYATSRAVSSLRIILELEIPFLKVNGKLLAYKGINYMDEVNEAKGAFNKLNSKLINTYEYHLNEYSQTRYILEVLKIKNTDSKYPRVYSKIIKDIL